MSYMQNLDPQSSIQFNNYLLGDNDGYHLYGPVQNENVGFLLNFQEFQDSNCRALTQVQCPSEHEALCDRTACTSMKLALALGLCDNHCAGFVDMNRNKKPSSCLRSFQLWGVWGSFSFGIAYRVIIVFF